MSKSNCNVAKDLMPLVIDGVASEDSQKYVEEHIAECTECAVTYGGMQVKLPLEKESAEKERIDMEKAAKKLYRRRRLRAILGILLSIVLVAGGMFAWNEIDYQLTGKMSEVVPLNTYIARVYQTSEGQGIIVLNLRDGKEIFAAPGHHYTWAGKLGAEKTALEIEMKTTVWKKRMDEDERNSAMLWRTIFAGNISEDGWYFEGYKYDEDTPPYDEIAIICGDERQVIYTRGDKVPLCSPEMEEYARLYTGGKPMGKTSQEWRADLVKYFDTVPELQGESDEEYYKRRYVCDNGDLMLDALYYDVSRSTASGSGRVQVDIYSFPGGNPLFDLECEAVAVQNDTGACVQYRAVFRELKAVEEGRWPGFKAWAGRIEGDQWVMMVNDLRDEKGSFASLPVVRIELHAGDEVAVLWEEGDELQTPEEAKVKREAAMEAYQIQ